MLTTIDPNWSHLRRMASMMAIAAAIGLAPGSAFATSESGSSSSSNGDPIQFSDEEIADVRRESELAADLLSALNGLTIQDSDTTLGITIRGRTINFVLDDTIGNFDQGSRGTGTANGQEVIVETVGATFETLDSESTVLKITVAGEVVFNKPIDDITEEDGLRLLEALSVINSTELTISATQRAAAQSVGLSIGARVRGVLGSALRGNRSETSQADGDPSAITAFTPGGGMTGLAAGDHVGRREINPALWFTVGNNFLDGDQDFAKYDGGVFTAIAGVDFRPVDNFVTGLAISFERTDLDTDFNDGTLQNEGVGFVPYAAFSALDDKLVIDANVGYTLLDGKTERAISGTAPITGNSSTRRISAGANVSYGDFVGDFLLTGQTGAVFARDRQKEFTESNGQSVEELITYLGDWRTGVRGAYAWNDLEFVAGGDFVYDIRPWFEDDDDNNEDREAFDAIFAANWFPSEDVTVGLEVYNTFAREDTNNTGISFYLRHQW